MVNKMIMTMEEVCLLAHRAETRKELRALVDWIDEQFNLDELSEVEIALDEDDWPIFSKAVQVKIGQLKYGDNVFH